MFASLDFGGTTTRFVGLEARPQQKQEQLDKTFKRSMMAKTPPTTYGNQLKTHINLAK
jgi:hypothetical protein